MSKYNSNWIEKNTYYEQEIEYIEGVPVPHYKPYDRPVIVCLCGSTKFEEEYGKAWREEGEAGKIVLSVVRMGHRDNLDMKGDLKKKLDVLHLRKIDLADEVLILNPVVECCETCNKPLLFQVTGWYICPECKVAVTKGVKKTYIGESTRNELEYAKKGGKIIRFLNEP